MWSGMTAIFSISISLSLATCKSISFLREVNELPETYAKTLLALQHYLWNFARSGSMLDVLEEILRMFQESAAENVRVQQVVGTDPVEFPDELWLIKYQNKLRRQVKEAEQP